MFFLISAKTCSSQEKETENKCHMLQSMSKKKTKHTKFTNTKVSLFLTTKVNNKSQDDAVMQFLSCSRRQQCGGVNSSEKLFFKSLGTAFAVKAIKPL